MAEAVVSAPARFEEEYFLTARGLKLFTCRWLPSTGEIRGLVFLCHGYGVECSVFMKGVGERLAAAGYGVYGIDIEGHGRSPGLRAYIKEFDVVVDDCVSFFKSLREKEEYRGKPSFLFGESMGGATALLVHRKEPALWNGAVLVAPMCKIADKMKPPGVVISILRGLAVAFPTWKVVPTQDIIEIGCKEPEKRIEMRKSPYAYQDKPRLKTAIELLEVSTDLESRLNEVTIPFLLLHGDADKVTDPSVSQMLYEKSNSKDKTFRLYKGMWHALTFAEPLENLKIVFEDIITWLHERTIESPTS